MALFRIFRYSLKVEFCMGHHSPGVTKRFRPFPFFCFFSLGFGRKCKAITLDRHDWITLGWKRERLLKLKKKRAPDNSCLFPEFDVCVPGRQLLRPLQTSPSVPTCIYWIDFSESASDEWDCHVSRRPTAVDLVSLVVIWISNFEQGTNSAGVWKFKSRAVWFLLQWSK